MFARVHRANRKFIGVGMLFDCVNLTNDDVFNVFVDFYYFFNFEPARKQLVFKRFHGNIVDFYKFVKPT